MGYDENCNFFFIEQEGSPWHALYSEGLVLPDGTIAYRENIYHFKRIVYKQKFKNEIMKKNNIITFSEDSKQL